MNKKIISSKQLYDSAILKTQKELMHTGFLISVLVMVLFTMPFEKIYAQDQNIDEFLEWPSTSNYIFILIALVIMIIIAIIANYLWSNRKGRRFTME